MFIQHHPHVVHTYKRKTQIKTSLIILLCVRFYIITRIHGCLYKLLPPFTLYCVHLLKILLAVIDILTMTERKLAPK